MGSIPSILLVKCLCIPSSLFISVWSPSNQTEINKLEGIQRHFTSKIEGMEGRNYHERLSDLDLYSVEQRRERFMIIGAWRQIEGLTEDILGLETELTETVEESCRMRS